MLTDSFSFGVGERRTTAHFYGAPGSRAVLVLAPGAGAPHTHPWMVAIARAIAERGASVVTFNFLYAEAKRRAPDRNDVLEGTWQAAITEVRAKTNISDDRLFIGGKSMGGRIATQVAAAADARFAGLVLLGYPLHPPGKPLQLRSAHLSRVRAPMLFVQGSRDPFGSPDELTPVLREAGCNARIFVVEGGDHSFGVPKRSGGSLESAVTTVADEVTRFIGSR